MFAVVEIAGMQFEVAENTQVKVPLLKANPGDSLSFGNILLAGEGSEIKLGNPFIEGSVNATLVKHGHDPKVIVFKKKRRKGFQKSRGHRQDFSVLEITGIRI